MQRSTRRRSPRRRPKAKREIGNSQSRSRAAQARERTNAHNKTLTPAMVSNSHPQQVRPAADLSSSRAGFRPRTNPRRPSSPAFPARASTDHLPPPRAPLTRPLTLPGCPLVPSPAPSVPAPARRNEWPSCKRPKARLAPAPSPASVDPKGEVGEVGVRRRERRWLRKRKPGGL